MIDITSRIQSVMAQLMLDIMERELGDRFVRNSGGSVFVIE